jgi:DNA-binding transcriptional regulator YiaG
MDQNLKTGGLSDSLTPSTRLLNQKLGISPELRRLTPSEIELLIRSKQELAEQAFATVTRASTHKVQAAV